MSRLDLTLACGHYDRTEALRTGLVQPEGIDLNYISVTSPPEIFSRMLDLESFDASEMSLSQYFTLRARGDHRFTALPVFPSRVFRHGFIFVRDGITSPSDIGGTRIGVPEYWQTAAIWIRGILAHEYGVDLDSCQWFEGGLEAPLSRDERRGRLARTDGPRPQLVAEGACLNEMLASGDLDVVIGARKPSCVGPGRGARRLFENYREVEREYFHRTGIFPIMHTLVVRTAVLERHPWVAESLFKAFSEAKAWCLGQMRFTGTIRYTLPWLFYDIDEIDELFGGDPWPYGLDRNLHTLESFASYLGEQGFIDRPIDVADHFATVVASTQ
ncbi:MAG TPA: hypothetical protein VFP54_02120 [Acidimicrobiales bacterium]|nr:hypothetical protein [Acidimicrobiales bacterium]